MNTTYSTKQSAVAMRKRMSDDTNKYNFNRKRILDRIREGSIPQQNTTKKYDISNAEVNAIRKEGNHPPLVVAFAPSAYAPTLAVNEETNGYKLYLELELENVKEETRNSSKTYGRTAWKNTQSSAGVPGRCALYVSPETSRVLPEFQTDLNWLNNFNAVTKKKADSYIADKEKYTIKYGSSSTFPSTPPSRDDLGKLVINPPNMTGNVEKTMNYIVKKNGVWTIYLNVYKTMDFFGRVVVRFSDATSKLISNYITKHQLKNGEHLFGTFGKDGKMSATIAAWLVEAGIKDGKVQGQTKTPGAINLLRHAYISQKIKEEDVMKLSETMKHSPLATELYVRKIQPILVENMIKIDERKLVYEEPEMIQTRSKVLEKRKREEEAKKKAKKGRVVVI
ncbi:unnamed protein product [Bathycoccus prasinos]